jgi:hypothetical protein
LRNCHHPCRRRPWESCMVEFLLSTTSVAYPTRYFVALNVIIRSRRLHMEGTKPSLSSCLRKGPKSMQGGEYGTVLQAVSLVGQAAIVTLLLENGAIQSP